MTLAGPTSATASLLCLGSCAQNAVIIKIKKLRSRREKKSIAIEEHFRLFIKLSNQLDANLLCGFASRLVILYCLKSTARYIMKTTTLATVCLLVYGANPVMASSKLTRLLSYGAKPVGMEQSCFGTLVQFSSGESSVALDASQNVSLPLGASKIEFTLSEPAQLRDIAFENKGGAGLVDVYASLDGKKWVKVGTQIFKSADSKVSINQIGAYSRHLWLDFQMSQHGEVGVPQLLTSCFDADFHVSQNDGADSMVNFATGLGGARLIYSTSMGSYQLEGVRANAGEICFDSKKDKSHYLVFDLQSERSISEIGASSLKGFESVAVYAGNELMELEDWKGRLTLPLAALKQLKLLGKVSGKDGFKLAAPADQRVRFVALELNADKVSESMVVGSLSIIGAGKVEKRVKGKFDSQSLVMAEAVESAHLKVGIVADEAQAKPIPSVFAWDLERNLASNLITGSGSSSGYGSIFQSSVSSRSRRADEGVDPDPDPPGIEILRCDFVSEP